MCKILVARPEGKRPIGRPIRRWKDNMKLILKKWGGVVWTFHFRSGTSGKIMNRIP
jgi:hypothetical protein